MARIRLELFPRGSLQPNDEKDDPLDYYYHPLVGGLYRRRIEAGLSLLKPPYGRILEIGYGSGILLPTLVRLGRKVCGVDLTSDPSSTMARLKQLGITADLYAGDVCTWSGTGELFDLVVAFSIFEHVADPRTALASVARLLKPEGRLLIGMPRVDKAMVPLFSLIGYHGIENHHITTYREVVRAAAPHFKLARLSSVPRVLPRWAGLYYNMLFVRTPASSPSADGDVRQN